MTQPPEPKREARDFSVRGLPPPDGRTRAAAAKLGVEVYDGRDAALAAGLVLPWRWRPPVGTKIG
jgi:hypothetical protein